MSQHTLTPEQEQVIHHPLGCHARVLAVAGSGKSTTMAYRIQNLVEHHQVRPGAIQVLMFNALARKQFASHLDAIGLPETHQPVVHTFHSFSFQVIGEAVKCGLLPSSTEYWLADKSELIWLTVKRAINELERARRIPPEAVDPEEALNAISLWKSALIPPQRAGSNASPYLPQVYAGFEQLRLAASALTFDDFVPTAIDLLENNAHLYNRYCRDLKHIIVDEYQDINLGQQHLIEILASEPVDLMVVGDDDQTIYEWRGARPNYIIRDFARVFNAQPVRDYRLSRSFRFGPIIAQCAANVIACNAARVEKPLIACQVNKTGFIQVIQGGMEAVKEMTDQTAALLQTDQVPPSQIIVLARLYAQLDNLEAEFLSRAIPYRVDGQEPFYKRREINALLDYIRLARDYTQPMTEHSGSLLLSIANKPSRMLSRSLLNRMVTAAVQRRQSPQQCLESAPNDRALNINHWQADHIMALWSFMEDLCKRLLSPTLESSELLMWMVKELDYLAYFQDYYGKGENSDEKAHAVVHFIKYVSQLGLSPLALLDYLAKLDTTQGRDGDDLVIFTTIYRTKGLEYDYVLIPQCDEGMLPYLKGEHTDVFDTQGLAHESQMSGALENERRLFYVALTRARKGVLIGASAAPSRFISEMALADTQAVMSALQWLASGDPHAGQDLRDALKQAQPSAVLLNNLVNGYLPDLKQGGLLLRDLQASPSA